tara:strand:- start:1271 stop:1657 length:387 start_codon:yes stop_codon:yes gene_type:complete
MNRVIITGNLGVAPEVRPTKSGTTVCNLSVATNERVKQNGEWVDHTEWHRIVVFGGQAESCGKYLAKGSKVAVEGKLRTRTYTDKQGTERRSTEVLADRVEFMSRANQSQNNAPPQQGSHDQFDEIPF